MRITSLLKPEAVKIGGVASDKDDAIAKLVKLMETQGNVVDIDAYTEAVHARESFGSTALGEGIAIPHAKTAAVSAPGLAAMTLPDGVDYDAPDGLPTTLMFLIAAPDTKADVHLEVLSRLSMLLMDPEFCNKLRAAKSSEEFLAVIDAAEDAKVAAENAKAAAAATADAAGYDLVAITACPTGIAHTYMAAEALENKAKEMGLRIKVETQGSAGAKNVLTPEDIAGAKGVIIAADKNIELSRFDGKPLYSCPVSRGINEPEALINEVMEGRAPIHHNAGGAAAPAATSDGESTWHKIYKHLMNGVSHMLPFVIGGGILTAIAFLVDQPGLGTSAYGSSIPAAALFKTIGGEAFGLMLPILAGYIASSIADRPGLAPGFVGGLFAKAGYDFAYLGTLDATTLVSGGFIAALFAGFAAGYLTLGIERACDKLPSSLEGIKPMLIYPVLGTLAIGVVMLALNPVFAAINTALNGFLAGLGTSNIVVLGLVLGGMMSVDMGGPFNKAAYVFGTAALDPSSGLGTTGQVIMASVMVGGMVPPLVIALSTTFFKNRWTKQDRNAGLVNYIMGLSFISEGAIPFAAADPGHVLPSCIIGSAIAGGLSAAFGCTSPAPHGGAWVAAVIGNPAMWLVACLVGSVVGCLILSFWKKPLPPEESGLEK
ncbi:MAG: fructose-specific PTS transporter subunit EIIC [Parolsenella sp.]|uniref:PTS fructose transporter subunit IIABC n=1 Tax=Parolsenella sp. TaxID=2083006 RepID=UPI002E77068C|nr:fructose-specific PTS transporter subunit EIIC [Parolsenella sp.]MEE1372212.1 fructose-specific PTS transporter subunit EIIC [Parolsenella sp.]